MSTGQRFLTIVLGIVVFLGLVLSPSLSPGFIDIYNEKRIIEGIILLVGSVYFFLLLNSYTLNIDHSTAYIWGVFFLLMTISIFLSEFHDWALLEIGWYFCLLQLSLVIAYLYQKFPNKFEQFLLFVISCMVMLYIIRIAGDIITVFFDPNWPRWPDHTRSAVIFDGVNIAKNGFLGFKNVRFLNHLHTWSLPILVYGYIKYARLLTSGFRYFILFLISSWWMLVFASGARGTLLSLLLSLVVVYILYSKEANKWIKYCLSTCIGGGILYIIIFYILIPEGSGKELARTVNNRTELWWPAWQAIKANILFGVGPMHLAKIQGENPITSPHNIYLMWAAEWGVPAFILGLYIAVRNLWGWIKNTLNNISIKHIAISTSLFAGIIHSGVSGLMLTPLSQLLFAIILGWIIGVYYTDQKNEIFISPKALSIPKWSTLLFVLLLNLFVFIQVFTMVPDLKENRDEFYRLSSKDKLGLYPTSRATIYPRFWDQGFIDVMHLHESD